MTSNNGAGSDRTSSRPADQDRPDLNLVERDNAEVTQGQPPSVVNAGPIRGSHKAASKRTASLRREANALKRFFLVALPPLLFVAALLGAILIAYQPASFIDKSWPHFQVFQRWLFWFLRGTAVRSLLGLLTLLVIYCVFRWFRIRKKRFIVVSEFRVWGNLVDEFPPLGVAARLRDELMLLCKEIKGGDIRQPLSLTNHTASTGERDSSEAGGEESLYYGGLSLPETYVTVQYQGISVEGIDTFVRRITGREVVISGDLMSASGELTLAARTNDEGPWGVAVEGSDSDALNAALQKLALRIMVTLTPKFQPRAANAFVVLQRKARKLKEHYQALHLAELGFAVAPDPDKARRNIARAHNYIGREFAEKGKYEEAILEFLEAIRWNKRFHEAWYNLAQAYDVTGKEAEAKEAFLIAVEIKKGRSDLGLTGRMEVFL
jgi:tetratricopeptide repeat protein